jgi:hypothetical protein
MSETQRGLDQRIADLDNEKFKLPYDYLKATYEDKNLRYGSGAWKEAEKATLSRKKEILAELRVLRAERKAAILARREARETKAAANRKTREVAREAITAECQICEHRQCLDRRGKMVHHGYLRPGYGQIEGDCPGVGYKPYPETDALAWYLRQVQAGAAETITTLADLPNRQQIVKTITWPKLQVVTIKVSEVDAYTWKREIEDLKWKLESQLRQLRDEVSRATKRIAAAVQP